VRETELLNFHHTLFIWTVMPRLDFSDLPDSARLWVFSCDPAPVASDAAALLQTADTFLDQWQAHGHPLSCARDWRDDRFLAIGVDQSTAGATGCSIDGLFRALRILEQSLGVRMVGGGSVFYRDADNVVRCVSRDDFTRLSEDGEISAATPVFDATLTTVGEWRTVFERPAAESWQSALLASA
jgi:hypothetical protein